MTNELQRGAAADLADVILDRRARIVARWMEQVAQDARAASVDPTDLQDGIDDYLERIAEAVRGRRDRGGQPPDAPDEQTVQGEGAPWGEVAKQHALTRVRIGFDISQLVLELITLRRILFDEIGKVPDLDTHQIWRMADILERSIAIAVKSYVDSRDYLQRHREAEHIGFITHELRNPLNVAILATAKLERMLNGANERELDLIKRSHSRLRDLIDQTLKNERFELGAVEVHAVDVRLTDIVDDAVRGARLTAAEKHLDMDVQCGDPDLTLHVDPELVTSAIQNLVDNAVKYTDEGRVALSVIATPHWVEVHVVDNCDGLTEEELRTIFLPFKRGRNPSKPGSGLGLAIARRAIEAHGGAIFAESRPGHGCHFWVTLPRTSH